MNLTDLQAKARMRNDLNSTKTIALTIAAFFLCYLPVLFYALVAQLDGSKANFWFSYTSWLVHCFSTIVNPLIYYTRAYRFRFALKQFLKDPFGKGDLVQNTFLKNPKRGMQVNLANTTFRSYHDRRNETAFVDSGANCSGGKAREERVIISSVSNLKAASQIEVGEREDTSSNFHRTQMFQDSCGEDDENTGIPCEERFYKLERVVECKSVTETRLTRNTKGFLQRDETSSHLIPARGLLERGTIFN